MWYDFFSIFYDHSLEDLYRSSREEAVASLQVCPDSLVLDMACGTGQNFPFLQQYIGGGSIVGIDLSSGMLRRARQRVQRAGWDNVDLLQTDVQTLAAKQLEECCGKSTVDFVICTLGMTVIADWESAFRRGYDLLTSGGRIVLFDAYADEWVLQTWSAKLIARADLSRRFWRPLEELSADFSLVCIPGSPHDFGGRLFIASGVKE
jgi:ubiquinone/menaquinone biosynthesis C-methylase UbiE